jgi:hypothetical protein
MKPLLRLCLVLAVALLLTPPAGWGAGPARSPQPPAAAAGLLDPISVWLARLLAPARVPLAPKAAPKAGVLPPVTSSTQATVSGHRGCIDPNGSPCA